jgi:hypothetical protein
MPPDHMIGRTAAISYIMANDPEKFHGRLCDICAGFYGKKVDCKWVLVYSFSTM